MSEFTDVALARETYETLCRMLDNNEFHYKKDEEALTITCTARGDDLPIDVSVEVDAQRMLVILLSQMPFTVPEDKRLDMAVAVSAINDRLVSGSFDYDVTRGKMFFRMSCSFIESKMGEEAMDYILFCSFHTIDAYNDRLMMLSKGFVPLEKFLEDVMS